MMLVAFTVSFPAISVTSAIIPSAIANYVKAMQTGLSVVKISRKRGGCEIKLSNGVYAISYGLEQALYRL